MRKFRLSPLPILRAVLFRNPGNTNLTELAESFTMPMPALIKHLKVPEVLDSLAAGVMPRVAPLIWRRLGQSPYGSDLA